MNLWVRKSGLILLSALILFSCEEDLSTIGLPPENDLGIFFVDVPLGDKISQVWVDNLNSRGTGNILVGSYQDEYLGHIEAQNFSELALPSLDPGKNFEDVVQFDSLVLETRISGVYGNDVSSMPQHIEIYQLTDTLHVSDSTYHYTTDFSQEVGQKLAESQFFLYPDSIGLTFDDTGRKLEDKEDSVYKETHFDSNEVYIYRSTFKINDAFGQEFFDKVKNRDNAFKKSENFGGYFKGISFVSDPTNSAVITYGAANTRMVLYYTETDSIGAQSQKTLNFGVLLNLSYNNIKPNKNNGWSGSDFDDLTSLYEPYTTSTDLAYLQSGTNLLLKIDLSAFQKFTDTVKNAAIQRAELVFNNIKDASGNTPPPTNMIYYLTSIDSLANKNYRLTTLRDNGGSSTLVSAYDDEDNEIRNNITLALQSLIYENEYNQLIMAPVYSSSGVLIPDTKSVSRLVLDKNDMHIRFYYTIPDKNN